MKWVLDQRTTVCVHLRAFTGEMRVYVAAHGCGVMMMYSKKIACESVVREIVTLRLERIGA